MFVLGTRHRKKHVSNYGLFLSLLMDHLELFLLLSLLGFFYFLCILSGQFLFILFIMLQQLLLSRILKKKGTTLCLVDKSLILFIDPATSSMRVMEFSHVALWRCFYSFRYILWRNTYQFSVFAYTDCHFLYVLRRMKLHSWSKLEDAKYSSSFFCKKSRWLLTREKLV